MIRIALAGLGVHGSRYARHLLAGDIPGAALVAVSRADEAAGRAFAAGHGLEFVADPVALARHPGVDAVVSAVPPDLHRAIALAAIEAGKALLIEKPLAASLEDADAIAAAAEGAAATVAVAHTQRFDPLFVALRERLPSLGALRVLAIDQRFDPGARPWTDAPGRGGALLVTGVHAFDLARWLTGAEPVSVVAETSAAPGRATEDTFAAVLRLEPGDVVVTIDNCHRSRGRSGRVSAAGTSGQLAVDHATRRFVKVDADGESDLGSVPHLPTVVPCLRDFVVASSARRPAAVSVEDGLAAVRIADAVRRSAREGRRLSLA
ncbi:MAG TPA: Gfo/Idh/MocA family oxidoreductase [Candidatus Polarisedimenticolaceae bacterium]